MAALKLIHTTHRPPIPQPPGQWRIHEIAHENLTRKAEVCSHPQVSTKFQQIGDYIFNCSRRQRPINSVQYRAQRAKNSMPVQAKRSSVRDDLLGRVVGAKEALWVVVSTVKRLVLFMTPFTCSEWTWLIFCLAQDDRLAHNKNGSL